MNDVEPEIYVSKKDQEWRAYLAAAPLERLMILQNEWSVLGNDPKTRQQRTFLEGWMLELTIGMPEHPEWFGHNCLCDLCRSYA